MVFVIFFFAIIVYQLCLKRAAIETPLKSKLRLIHLFRHMHHKPRLAVQVLLFQLCILFKEKT